MEKSLNCVFEFLWEPCIEVFLFKLEYIGVSDSLLLWFKKYLADRKQRVVLPGAARTSKSIKAGVPQVSIIGTPPFSYLYKWYCRRYAFMHQTMCR